MGHLVITNSPLGGLDTDSEDYALDPSDYRDMVNIRNTFTYLNVEKTAVPVKGNVLVSFDLGNVYHKKIGQREDKQDGSIVYFLFAADSNHKILRWYPGKIDGTHPNGTIELIIAYDFGWTAQTNIHSSDVVNGKLLYWVDPIPRKINMEKANLNNKQKTWKVVLPWTYVVPNNAFNIVITDFATGDPVDTIPVTTTSGQTIEEALADIALQINNYGFYLTAESCNCSMTITEKEVNAYNISFSDTDYQVIPENWYGNTLVDRFFDACKYPSLYQPLCEFKKDPNTEYNFVRKHIWQFRTQYEFDDFEKSVDSPISQIAINNTMCDGTINDAYNYIEVDLNDPELLNPVNWVLIKKINILVREHNTGDWNRIDSLEVCEIFGKDGVDTKFFYKFYNNNNVLAQDSITFNQPYDLIPVTALTEKVVENRMVYAGLTDGMDTEDCIKAKITQDFAEDPPQKLYRIRFFLRIMTYGLGDTEQQGFNYTFYDMFPDYKKYPFWQDTDPDVNYVLQRGGIFHDILRTENDFAFYGGGGFGASGGGDFGIRAGMEDAWDQRTPEGGFPIYFANTPYFGVTKQVNVGLPVDTNGALDTSTEGNRDAIGAYLYATSNNDLYSVVEIWAPAGEYVARVASNWCSYDDKLGKGSLYNLNGDLGFQKTSAAVWGTYAANGGPYVPGSWQQTKEIRVTVTNSDIDDAGTFVIMDLAPPFDANISTDEARDFWTPIGAYVYDSLGTTDVNSADFTGIPVELAAVNYEDLSGIVGWQSYAFTDHNGYFFGISALIPDISGITIVGIQINAVEIFNTSIINIGSLSQLYTKDLVATNFGPGTTFDFTSAIYGIVATDTADARANCSTIVQGTVIDQNGDGVAGVNLVFCHGGGITSTDSNGDYDFIVWGDMLTPNLANLDSVFTFDDGTKRQDDLIFNGIIFCIITYPDGQVLNLDIDPINNTGGYDPTNPFLVPDFEIDEAFDPGMVRLKRGGRYIWVIRYSDIENRYSSCVMAAPVYIPFITEDLNKYLPGEYPVPGTFRRGQPILNWEIDALAKPPKEAATYQWMRSKNLIYANELQWVINEVTYLVLVSTLTQPEVTTAYVNADATAIKLSISNITDYFRAHNDSQISYEFQEGDRLRIIADRSLTYFNSLIDVEIISYEEESQSLIIKTDGIPFEITSGFFIEIYNLKSIQSKDQQEFWECGETFACTHPGHDDNEHSVLTGTFTGGDTYWRGRVIRVNDPSGNFSASYPVTVEDPSASDFFPSMDQDIGRVGVIDKRFRKIFRGTAIRVSDKFLPDTAINGLCSFRDITTVELDKVFGSIRKLELAGYVLLSIHENKCVSNYIGRVLSKTGDNSLIQANTDQFIGDSRPLLGDMGTQNPESVVECDGYIYGLDGNRGLVWRYAGDGLNPISSIKMRSFFAYYRQNGVWQTPAIVDRQYNEYIITIYEKLSIAGTIDGHIVSFINPVDIIAGDYVELQYLDAVTGKKGIVAVQVLSVALDKKNISVDTSYFLEHSIHLGVTLIVYYRGTGKTIAWSEPKNRWTTRYSFVPYEGYGVLNKDLVSFVDGKLWVHDRNPIHNNFYGIQYKSSFTTLLNALQQQVKLWFNLMVNSKQDNGAFNWKVPSISNKNGQASELDNADFIKREEYWHAAFKRDKNTPGQTYPLLDGAVLRNSVLTVVMENDYTGEFDLRAVNAGVEISERNVK